MTDPVTFGGIEKQHLVRFGHSLILSNMPHINATIGKDELRGCCALLRALVSASTPAQRVPNRNRRRLQQRLNGKFRRVIKFAFRPHAFDPLTMQKYISRPLVRCRKQSMNHERLKYLCS